MEKTILTTIPAEKQKDYPLAEEFIDIYELALANDFDKVMEQLTGEHGDYYMKDFIAKLESQIKNNRSSADDIKNRSFIQRLTSPNISDIGGILSEQNAIQTMFYIMLQLQTLSGTKCALLLKSLSAEVNKHTEQEVDSYGFMAKAFLRIMENNNAESCKNDIRDNALMKLLKDAKITRDELRAIQSNTEVILSTKADKSSSYTKEEINEALIKKQDSISDIDTIRTNAQKGATSLQPTDIADWAKTKDKPSYTADEVGALPDSTFIPSKMSDLNNDRGFLTEHQDISGKADISFVEKQLQCIKDNLNQEVTTLQQTLQKAQEDLQKEHQGYEKLKRALITTSIGIGTISMGALIALLILIL